MRPLSNFLAMLVLLCTSGCGETANIHPAVIFVGDSITHNYEKISPAPAMHAPSSCSTGPRGEADPREGAKTELAPHESRMEPKTGNPLTILCFLAMIQDTTPAAS